MNKLIRRYITNLDSNTRCTKPDEFEYTIYDKSFDDIHRTINIIYMNNNTDSVYFVIRAYFVIRDKYYIEYPENRIKYDIEADELDGGNSVDRYIIEYINNNKDFIKVLMILKDYILNN